MKAGKKWELREFDAEIPSFTVWFDAPIDTEEPSAEKTVLFVIPKLPKRSSKSSERKPISPLTIQ